MQVLNINAIIEQKMCIFHKILTQKDIQGLLWHLKHWKNSLLFIKNQA